MAKNKKLTKQEMETYKKAGKKLTKGHPSQSTMKAYKKASLLKKTVAKKTVGKVIGRALPGVGAVLLARDIIKGASKATCGKRGGKWVSGKCVGTKKAKFKKGSPVKDPISKR